MLRIEQANPYRSFERVDKSVRITDIKGHIKSDKFYPDVYTAKRILAEDKRKSQKVNEVFEKASIAGFLLTLAIVSESLLKKDWGQSFKRGLIGVSVAAGLGIISELANMNGDIIGLKQDSLDDLRLISIHQGQQL